MNLFLRVSAKDQILFARNIALMSKSGMTLLDSLQMIQRQTQSRSLRQILTTVSSDLQNGQFLSTALKKYENVFGTLFINIIRVGEASGTLAENLGFLADELKKKQELRGKIVNAMIYPIIILITTVALTGVLTFLVFPKIIPIFDGFNVELPLSTRIVIGTNKFMLQNWPWILLALVVLVIGTMVLIRLKPVKRVWDRLLLHIPVVGKLVQSIQMSIMARTFSLLLKSGVKIVEAMSITADIIPNETYKSVIQRGTEEVKLGSPLGKFLSRYPTIFPVMFSQMIEISETAGTLDATLLYLSQYYESELDERTQSLVSLMEPLLMVFMGGLIGFMAIAIILPIYSISQNIGG